MRIGIAKRFNQAGGSFSGIFTFTSGIAIFDSGTEPTCNSTNRGYLVWVEGGAGVADTFRICSKDGADSYGWRTLM